MIVVGFAGLFDFIDSIYRTSVIC